MVEGIPADTIECLLEIKLQSNHRYLPSLGLLYKLSRKRNVLNNAPTRQKARLQGMNEVGNPTLQPNSKDLGYELWHTMNKRNQPEVLDICWVFFLWHDHTVLAVLMPCRLM